MAEAKVYDTVLVRPFLAIAHNEASLEHNTVKADIMGLDDDGKFVIVFSQQLRIRSGEGKIYIPVAELSMRMLTLNGVQVHKITKPKPVIKKAKPAYVPRPLTHRMRIRTDNDEKAARELLRKSAKANQRAIGKEAIKSAVNGLTKEAGNE